VRSSPIPATRRPPAAVTLSGVPSTGHAAIAVTAGTTNNRLLVAVAPRCRINANIRSGPPTPVTSVSQSMDPTACALSGTLSDPDSGARTAIGAAPPSTSSVAIEPGPASTPQAPVEQRPGSQAHQTEQRPAEVDQVRRAAHPVGQGQDDPGEPQRDALPLATGEGLPTESRRDGCDHERRRAGHQGRGRCRHADRHAVVERRELDAEEQHTHRRHPGDVGSPRPALTSYAGDQGQQRGSTHEPPESDGLGRHHLGAQGTHHVAAAPHEDEDSRDQCRSL
jgi:hypothetical protein